MQHKCKRIGSWLGLLTALLVLAGCGGGGDDDHKDTYIDTKGRLALAEEGSAVVRLRDLDNGTAMSFTMEKPVSALYASPGERYVVVVQRTDDRVQFIDGGVWQEDHVDHQHDYKAEPKLMPFRIAGPQPTHYDDRHGRASIFMDGRAGPPLQGSYAVLLDDASIAQARLIASMPPLPYAVHGFAEPNGEHLVVTHRSSDAVDTLPNYLHIYSRTGEGFNKTAELPTRCDRMHGSYTRQTITVAGCDMGAAIVQREANGSFTSRFAAAGHRLGTIAGHPAQSRMIGMGNAGTPSTTYFYDIDTTTARTTPITIEGWAEGRLRRAHGFDRRGQQFFVLDSQGTLSVLAFESGAWRTKKRITGVIAQMPTAAPFPAFAANGAKDEVYFSDPLGKSIVTIDTAKLEVASRTSLDFTPAALAWTGIRR